ncbi:MAG: protein GlmU [Desulfobacteraceae bacterium]|jgi:UDP-N-acetylglucosamine/UDP-N-acetylgalactosamine diphosphorylase
MEKTKDLLIKKGVKIPCPESVEIGDDINPDRISGDNVIIHSGCKLYGPETLILPGVKLGYETPATIHDCQVGKNVELSGGYYLGSTFLENSGMGSGAHIRQACLLEEGARGAHTVGLKQTILFPFVTLGSLINFCDCLMAGGTDSKNHSEVGSSYIHFNYTQNQDKATASLVGDIPRGVMINQKPIFLGGQGGMVGPVTIEYGTIVAAGTIVRKDIDKPDTMLLGNPAIARSMPFHANLYSNLSRIIKLNINYIASLIALRAWYINIRSLFICDDFEKELHKGAVEKLDAAIGERLKQLRKIAEKMPESIEVQKSISDKPSEKMITKKKEYGEKWPDIEEFLKGSLEENNDNQDRDDFTKIIENAISQKGYNYITVVKGLEKGESQKGSDWLQGIVDSINSRVWEFLPSF